MAGMVPFFTMLTEADLFDRAYPGYFFYYTNLVPQNLAVPLSFICVKYLSKFRANSLLITTGILTILTSYIMLLFPMFWKGSLDSYLTLMLVLFVNSGVNFVYQSYSLVILLWFDEKYLKYYYLGNGVINIFASGLRLGIVSLEIPVFIDVSSRTNFRLF